MNKIFVDCDILLEVSLERQPFCQASSELLNHLETHPNTGFIAWHSISNVFYIFAKATTQEKAKNFILELCQFIQIVPTSNADVWAAANLPMKDFEEALQCAAALACEADVIVTRHLEDYQQAPIHAMTPTQILNALQVEQTTAIKLG